MFMLSSTRIVIFCVWVSILINSISCVRDEGAGTVRGMVVDFQTSSVDQVSMLMIHEDDTAKIWTFHVNEYIGFRPSHLRQHMLLGESLAVHYETIDGETFAVMLTD